MNEASASRIAHENSIFNSLSVEDYTRIQPHLEDVCLSVGQNLYEYGDAIQYVYFPLDAVIHLFLTMKSGATLEAGIVSSEGLLGFAVFMGAETVSSQAIVLHSNRALRIRADIIKQEFNRGGHLQQLILRYINAFCVQLSQTAACNRIHQMEARLCRWLLMMHDRLENNCLNVTQDFIAQMLGTPRTYITAALGSLQREMIVKCHRGRIEILDRQSLERNSCECYEVIRREFGLSIKTKNRPANN